MRPSFSDLTPAQQALFGNGLGPFWWPDRLRTFVTSRASWFFGEASWRHHDFGYAVGGDRWDRARCDWRFFQAMWRDAWRFDRGDTQSLSYWLLPTELVAAALSVVFYLAVRLGGQFGSFQYRDRYATLSEALEFSRG
jgi:hypothetical protein